MFDFNEANELLAMCKEDPKTVELFNNFDTRPYVTKEEKEIQNLRESIKIDELVKQSEAMQVSSVEEATQALSMALQARKIASGITASKKEITKPHVDFQKAVNKLVSDHIETLEEIERFLTDRIEAWIDSSTNQAYSSGLASIKVPDGSLQRVNTWKYEIEEACCIPPEFLCVNTKEIERAISSGVRHIPGVRIFLTQEIKLRVKN